jgi:hypothetical protein
MTSTGRTQYNFACLALGSTLAAGCGAGGASGSPEFEGESPPAATPGAPSEPSDIGGTPTLPPAQLLPETAPEPVPGSGSCVTVSAEVELLRQPVDIIITIDNSGSMDDEARAVEDNLNVNFAAILEQSGIDYRVILVTEHRERDAQDTAVCIASPLSSLAACPSDVPGPSDRFFHYATEVNSRNSLEVLLETFNGEGEDDFGLAPRGWSEWLRPEAKKTFLEITDDDSNVPAIEFVSALTALAPEQFGVDPSQLGFVWHSIVGLAERATATEPYEPGDPIETRECTGDVFNAGSTYQELSRLTGGLRFPICEFGGYDSVFRSIATDVLLGSRNVCDFELPTPPSGRELDLDKVAVSYQPGGGAEPLVLGRALGAEQCRADGFVVDGAGVHLCPEACDRIGADEAASVSVLFACESTLLR